MATTQTTYTGNGSTTNYSFTFEYLKQADVKVTLNTVATTAFTFANATTLAFNTAPASGVAIRIFRDTAIDNLSATFFPGSAIKAEDLNENFTQNLYVTQESHFEVDTANTTADTAKTTANTALTNSTTAISTANTATTTANTAITTSNSATTTANAATTTANTASTNASSAVTTANTASTNATAAVNTANTASTNASAAVTTANSAQADATTAISTANSATTTANSATTTANSALTSANTANTNATAAQSAATTAQASATAAQTSATAAQTSATAAQAQATLAADVRNAFTVTDSNSDGTFDFVVGDIPIKGNAGVKLPFESVTYAEEGAIRYNNSLDKIELYNGAGQWVTAGGGASVSSTPPTLPSAGDVWYDHDNGRAYVYYNDGDSNQWVEMNPSWNGYVADNSVTSAKIVDGAIVNADVNSSAAISQSKLNLDITNSEINASAAIALSKLSTGALPSAITVASSNIVDGTIVNADVNASAAISQSKLALDITNSEVNASAAIAGTKISPDFGSQNVITTGSVGIGTTSPTEKLSVDGKLKITNDIILAQTNGRIDYDNGNSSGALRFHSTSANSERLRIDSSGRLLLGLSSSIGGNALLQVQGSGNRKAHFHQPDTGSCITQFTNSTTGSGSTDGLLVGLDSTEDGMLWLYENQNLTFATNNSERMRIDSSGNLGVGTASPGTKLDVVGGPIRTDDIFTLYKNSTDAFYIGSGTMITNGLSTDIGLRSNQNGSILFSTNGSTERVRIQSGGGISFNGDTAAANALDDYEEGTWTPTLSNGGVISSFTASYVKIGNWVEAYFYIIITSITNNSSQFRVAGLPYTCKGGGYYPVGNIGYAATFNVDVWRPVVAAADTYVYFHRVDGSSVNFTNANAQGMPLLLLSIAYCTT